jgi:hypothetical protein
MPSGAFELAPIPAGFQIFESGLEVAGIAYRKDDALEFAQGRDLHLELEREEANSHDSNAIRVIGCHRGLFGVKRRFIGYVPSGVAKLIVGGGYYDRVLPRLLNAYVADSGFIQIEFQILGPKGEALVYKRVDPKSLPQEALGKQLHFTDFVDQVRYLKQQKRNEEAIALLEMLVGETEKEAKSNGHGVAPWYYEQLAGLYRKAKQYEEELRTLERYDLQPKAPGAGPIKLAQLLVKARERIGSLPRP